MGNKDYKNVRRIVAVLLCAFIFAAFMPETPLAFDSQTETESAEMLSDGASLPDDFPEDEAASAEEISDEEDIELTEAGPETIVDSDLTDDPDVLLEGYLDKQLTQELSPAPAKRLLRKSASSKRRETLNEGGKLLYDDIRSMAESIASGERESSIVTVDISELLSRYYVKKQVKGVTYNVITSESLGISEGVYVKKFVKDKYVWTFSDEARAKLYDFPLVLNALLADEPYLFYWYDKTSGVIYNIPQLLLTTSGESSDAYFKESDTPVFEGKFSVSANYGTEGEDRYSADTNKTGAASAAVDNAAAIIDANKDKSDPDKLNAYKDEICRLTSYNSGAANDPDFSYGDPWQMIYVFDGIPETKVVCEGYSKAFQYLCDHTDFDDDRIMCDIAEGIMRGSSRGPHMWNILHMDDGENYIADLTNSDSGKVGSRGGLFLSKAVEGGSVKDGYSYDYNRDGTADISYYYSDDMIRLFSESELMMAEYDYSGPHSLISDSAVYQWSDDLSLCTATCECSDCDEVFVRKAPLTKQEVTVPPSCTEMGTTTYTAVFRQSELGTQTKDVADVPVIEHPWDSGRDSIPATCTEAGVRLYTCTMCGDTKEEPAPKLGHDYIGTITTPAKEGVEGVMTYTCSRCGDSYTEIIPAVVYPVDLPAVKITKPKAGKKKATVKWKKVSKKNQKKIDGIEIQVAADRAFTDIVKTASGSRKKTAKVVKGLNKKTKYYVRIRAYKNAADGKHVSSWKVKSVKIK